MSVESHFAAGHLEQLTNLLGENAVSLHAIMEGGVVEFAFADGPKPLQHFLFAVWEVLFQPVDEQVFDLVREAQNDVAGVLGAGLGGF